MQVSITGRHVNATDNVKAHISEKLERCLGSFSRIESVHVVLDLEKRDSVAEVVVQAANHIRITAVEKAENLFNAIDLAIEHAERQMHKQREKITEHHK